MLEWIAVDVVRGLRRMPTYTFKNAVLWMLCSSPDCVIHHHKLLTPQSSLASRGPKWLKTVSVWAFVIVLAFSLFWHFVLDPAYFLPAYGTILMHSTWTHNLPFTPWTTTHIHPDTPGRDLHSWVHSFSIVHTATLGLVWEDPAARIQLTYVFWLDS